MSQCLFSCVWPTVSVAIIAQNDMNNEALYRFTDKFHSLLEEIVSKMLTFLKS